MSHDIALVVYEIGETGARIVEVREDPANGTRFPAMTSLNLTLARSADLALSRSADLALSRSGDPALVAQSDAEKGTEKDGEGLYAGHKIAEALAAAIAADARAEFLGHAALVSRTSAKALDGWPLRMLMGCIEPGLDDDRQRRERGMQCFRMERAHGSLLVRVDRDGGMFVMSGRSFFASEVFTTPARFETALWLRPMSFAAEWRGPAPAEIYAAAWSDLPYGRRRRAVEALFWTGFAGTLEDPFILQAPVWLGRGRAEPGEGDVYAQAAPVPTFRAGDIGLMERLVGDAVTAFAAVMGEAELDMLEACRDGLQIVAALDVEGRSVASPGVEHHYASSTMDKVVRLIEAIVRILEPRGSAWAGPPGARMSCSRLGALRMWYRMPAELGSLSAHEAIAATARLSAFLKAHGLDDARIASLLP